MDIISVYLSPQSVTNLHDKCRVSCNLDTFELSKDFFGVCRLYGSILNKGGDKRRLVLLFDEQDVI